MSRPRPAPEHAPQTPQDWLLVILFVVFIVAMLVAEIAWNFAPIKLGILFVLGFWMLLLVTHEAGHALAARWLECPVERIVLGMGWPLGIFRVRGIPVEVRLIPIEGFVRFDPTRLRWPRLGKAFVYFAGPGTDLLLGLAALYLGGWERFGERSDDYGHILWQSFVIASLAQGVLNLIPHSIATPQGDLPNDGLGILRSLFTTPGSPRNSRQPPGPFPRTTRDDDPDDPADWWKR